jgi:predicted transcriptional regulator
LESREGIEKLFFELASESRLSILREIAQKNRKLKDMARQLDLTQTEAFRQMQRLTETFLVEKKPDTTYGITEFGKLVLHQTLAFDFIFSHKDYFSTHDVWQLPTQFVDRIGTLSHANLQLDPIQNINLISCMIKETEQFLWGIGESAGIENLNNLINQKISAGVQFRFLGPAVVHSPNYEIPPSASKNFEVKVISTDVPVFVMVTEKEAAVGFRCVSGRLDYSGFVGKDSAFRIWAKDLFLYYWDSAKKS